MDETIYFESSYRCAFRLIHSPAIDVVCHIVNTLIAQLYYYQVNERPHPDTMKLHYLQSQRSYECRYFYEHTARQ